MTPKILFLDFETYYDKDYSLSKMTPPEYILDPRFEVIGCAVKEAGQPSVWVDGPDFKAWLTQYDPAVTTTVTYNALFDNCILAWEYGFVPSRMYCAMRMAAALYGHVLTSVSLSNVCKHFKLPPKGDTVAHVKGMRRADIMANPKLWEAYKAYSINDNDRCEDIFNILIPDFPSAERRIMDKVLRCAVEPKFIVDTKMLAEHLKDLDIERAQMLIDAGAQTTLGAPDMEDRLEEFAKELRSNPKFEALLKARGVDIEYKDSTTSDNKIPAFAKTDEFMVTLQGHDDPEVVALACARLGLRSTIERSRGERMLAIASLDWDRYRNGNSYPPGTMPLPLRYAGAHTHRLSGEWKINPQNLPSGRQGKSKLRKALMAPPGYKVVVADLAQIECRINAWLCGQRDLLDMFKNGDDPYSVLASYIFGIRVDKNVHKIERFIGKTGELGLGFGCGPDKFYNMVIQMARGMGMNMQELHAMWTPELAHKAVDTYRKTHSRIQLAWGYLGGSLLGPWSGSGYPTTSACLIVRHGSVEGPGGLKMKYNVLPQDEAGNLRYSYGRNIHRIWGSKFLENIVQFLARIVVMNAALRICDRGKINFSLQAHDELVFIVPDERVESFKVMVMEEMTRPPTWAKKLPLNAEVSHGQSYGDAK